MEIPILGCFGCFGSFGSGADGEIWEAGSRNNPDEYYCAIQRTAKPLYLLLLFAGLTLEVFMFRLYAF